MKIRIFGIAFLILVIAATGAFAQGQGARAGGQRQPGIGRAAQTLGLSQQQQDQIKGIVKQFHQDVKGIRQSSTTPQEKRTKITGLRKQAGEKIMALLTPEQRQKATQMKLVNKLLSPRAAMAMGFTRVLGQLNLSETQQAQVKTIMANHRKAVQAIQNDTTLTPEARRAKMQQQRQEMTAKIKAILTADQLAKFNQLTAKKPGRGAAK